ncbi:Hypothetical predicted protein [Podarcis lilfordi]|uniref:Uncharacterized protein n=1 Tax=Podarcis lilfordi TaxID=74358 RepID=A0AA35P3S4_9SAUR|nr:Hypothetical predicted protein [Podarcis lilfordi]
MSAHMSFIFSCTMRNLVSEIYMEILFNSRVNSSPRTKRGTSGRKKSGGVWRSSASARRRAEARGCGGTLRPLAGGRGKGRRASRKRKWWWRPRFLLRARPPARPPAFLLLSARGAIRAFVGKTDYE